MNQDCPPNIINLTGKTFNSWTVLRFLERKDGVTWFECQCACGTIQPVRAGNLRTGESKGCRVCFLGRRSQIYLNGRESIDICPRCKEHPKAQGQSYCQACTNALRRITYSANVTIESLTKERDILQTKLDRIQQALTTYQEQGLSFPHDTLRTIEAAIKE